MGESAKRFPTRAAIQTKGEETSCEGGWEKPRKPGKAQSDWDSFSSQIGADRRRQFALNTGSGGRESKTQRERSTEPDTE
jgi:hypothetical protein